MSDEQQPPQPPSPGGDQPPGAGYWKASDGNWYPPQQPQPPDSGGDQPPGPGYWKASDGNWYPPQQPQPQGQPPPAEPGGGMPGWAKGGLIVVAILAVFGLLGLACVAFVADEGGKAIDRAIDATDAAEGTTVPPGEDTTTQAPVAEGPEPMCTYVGTDPDSEDMQVELIFTNPLGEVEDLEATYALLDGEGGTRFFTDTVWVDDALALPRANEQFRISADTREEVPPNIEQTTIDCTVLAIEAGTDIGGFQRATDADTCTVIGTDPNGGIQVEVAVTNPFEETTNVQTWWALQAPGPVRFDGDTDVTEFVGAGESFPIRPEFGPKKPGWIGDGEVTCAVLGFWQHPG